MLRRMTRWQPSARALRLSALGALVMNTVIVSTGGAVRLTASGLGCPTWPRCTDSSLVATGEMGLHGAIEFGNRLLTYVLAAAVAVAIVAAMKARPRRRRVVWLAWSLFVGIVAQAVLGGITVLTGLNPVSVMAHFLLSMVLIAAAVVLYESVSAHTQVAVRRPLRVGAWGLVGVTGVTLFLGTVVTGSGPHSGDRDATHRLPFDTVSVTQLHADSVFLLLGLAVGMLVAARAARADALAERLLVLVVVVLGQGTIGFVQYATDLPVAVVAAHVLGACLVWIAAVRALVLLAPRSHLALSTAQESAKLSTV